jgi:tetratricopeptide (TPR) repeat protein
MIDPLPHSGSPSMTTCCPSPASAFSWETSPARVRPTPLLEAAVRDLPNDLSAGDSLGYVLGVLRGPGDALGAFERILRIQPDREWTLSYSALALRGLKRLDLARAALQKTIAVNPWRSDYRLGLARVCSQPGTGPGPSRLAARRSDSTPS